MRHFELLLITLNLLTLLLTMFSPISKSAWTRLSLFALVLVAGVQIFFEGPRWQLAPIYLLTCMILVSPICRLPKLVIGVIGGMATLSAVTLSLLFPVFHFEKLTGPHDVGTVTYHWVDRARPEVFSNDPKTRRELMVQIWYPAKKNPKLPYAPYVNEAKDLSRAQANLHGWPSFVLGHLRYIESNAGIASPRAIDHQTFPVLIFLEGITGYRQMNTFQVEHLVSRGYVVVAIDQPFIAATVVFPDGRTFAGLSKVQMDPLIQQSISAAESAPSLQGIKYEAGIIPYLAQDVSFVLDQLFVLNTEDQTGILRHHLDLNRVGIFGVSLGGIVVGEACRVDHRLRACLVMDAPMTSSVVQVGLRQPSMWITRDAQTMRDEGWTQFDVNQHVRTMRTVFGKSKDATYFVQVAGMFHANLTDVPYFSPLLRWFGITGPIDTKRAHLIINTFTTVFFDRHLAGQSSTILDGPSVHFPEVKLETK